MAGDLNSIVFKSENSVGMEKITLSFVVGIHLFKNHFQPLQILEYNFPLGTIFWPIFPVERGVHRVCEKGVYIVHLGQPSFTIQRRMIAKIPVGGGFGVLFFY